MGFHVEHRPVHPATSAVSPFLHELVHPGLDDLDREGVRELGKRLGRPATDPRRCAVPGDLEAQSLNRLRRATHASNDSQVVPSTPYEAFTVSCAERPAPTEQKHGLEQRGLSRAIVPADQRQPRWNLKLRVLDAAQTAHSELSENHGGLTGP